MRPCVKLGLCYVVLTFCEDDRDETSQNRGLGVTFLGAYNIPHRGHTVGR